jgi:hypothetical protein
LSRDHKHAPHDDEEHDDLDAERHAADEPTAVWDEGALRAAGLTDLLKKQRSEPPVVPATPAVSGAGDPSIVIDESIAANPGEPEVQFVSAALTRRGLGWGATLAIAVVLGALVYLAIRLVRG